MDHTKIRAYSKMKSVRLFMTAITVAVAVFLCYQLGKNVGEFLFHITH